MATETKLFAVNAKGKSVSQSSADAAYLVNPSDPTSAAFVDRLKGDGGGETPHNQRAREEKEAFQRSVGGTTTEPAVTGTVNGTVGGKSSTAKTGGK